MEACMKLGLKNQSDLSAALWNVLYFCSLVVDDNTLVSTIQESALLSEVSARTHLINTIRKIWQKGFFSGWRRKRAMLAEADHQWAYGGAESNG